MTVLNRKRTPVLYQPGTRHFDTELSEVQTPKGVRLVRNLSRLDTQKRVALARVRVERDAAEWVTWRRLPTKRTCTV